MSKTCFDRYMGMIKITRIVAALCGADVMKPNYKMSLLTWTVIIAINSFFCCTVYTMYVGLVVDGDWKVILQSLSLVGSAVQGYSKLLACIYRRRVMIAMNQYLVDIYMEYQKNDKTFQQVLKYRTNLTSKMLKTVLWIYVISALIIITYPLAYGLFYGEKLFVMQFLLPGIDSNTHAGYIIHNSFHIFLICLGAFGNFAGDMFIFIFIINIPLLKDILKIKCEKLNQVALKTHNLKETLPMLKDIVEWHQNYDKFVRQVEEVYYCVIFVQIFTSIVGICCTLFSIIIRSWPAAFAYLIYSFIMFYAYCGLGHLVEISNDEVIDVIYADCLWYELSVREQKLILLMIRKSQKPTNLTIGQIMPLSMSTALQLTKAIYSYMMMLLNFLQKEDF